MPVRGLLSTANTPSASASDCQHLVGGAIRSLGLARTCSPPFRSWRRPSWLSSPFESFSPGAPRAPMACTVSRGPAQRSGAPGPAGTKAQMHALSSADLYVESQLASLYEPAARRSRTGTHAAGTPSEWFGDSLTRNTANSNLVAAGERLQLSSLPVSTSHLEIRSFFTRDADLYIMGDRETSCGWRLREALATASQPRKPSPFTALAGCRPETGGGDY